MITKVTFVLLLEIIYCPNCGGLYEGRKVGRPDLETLMSKEKERCLLKFSQPNAKLRKKLDAWSLNLMAGSSCPGHGKCFSQAVLVRDEEGRLTTRLVKVPPAVAAKGPEAVKKWEKLAGREPGQNISCFAAKDQAVRHDTFAVSYRNEELVNETKNRKELADLIYRSIREQFKLNPPRFIRVHSYGDLGTEKYFLAWIDVARMFEGEIIFYAYTKSTWWAVDHEDEIPDNYRITLSLGGSKRSEQVIFDYIEANKDNPTPKFKVGVVVKNEDQARELGMPIDSDETIAAFPTTPGNKFFALIEHPQSKDALLYIRPEIIDIFKRNKQR